MGRRLGGVRGNLALGAMMIALATAGPARAEPEERPGDRAPAVTLDALPLGLALDALAAPARVRTETVLARTLFAQRIAGLRFPSREPVFRFLLEHPEFAAGVARALSLGEYRIERRDDAYWGDDERGARGVVRVLYGDDGRRLFHLEGRYEAPRLPAVEGQLLVLLEFRHQDDGRGGTVVDCVLTGHLRVDTPLVGALGRLVVTLARPAVERVVDRKVRRFFRTVARVSRWAHDQPEQLWAALDGHPELGPGPELATFRQILLADRLPAWARAGFFLEAPDDGAPRAR